MKVEKLDYDDEEKRSASVAQTDFVPCLSSNSHKKVTLEKIEFVKNLIERCLVLYMTKDETTTMLVNRAKIPQGFIHLVWQRLEEENPEFFKAYAIRVELKKQIISFNQLLGMQYHMMNLEHYAMQQSLNYGHTNMPGPESSQSHSDITVELPSEFDVDSFIDYSTTSGEEIDDFSSRNG